jgi:hypothetical protein
MRGQFALLPVGVVSALAALGCGGATQASLGEDAGTGTTVDAGGATSEGGSPFDPGAIGGLLGGGMDAGMMTSTPEGGTVGPDQSDAGPMMSLPPQQIMDGCSQLCTKEATAACAAQGTPSSCLTGCRLLASNPACSTETANLFSCATNATASCDAMGKAQLDGCGIQQVTFASCLFTKASDPSLSGPCANYCTGVAAAKCPNDKPGDCQASCPLIGGLFGCSATWKGYVTCAEHETFTCGTNGTAGASACIVPALGFFACAARNLSADAGM